MSVKIKNCKLCKTDFVQIKAGLFCSICRKTKSKEYYVKAKLRNKSKDLIEKSDIELDPNRSDTERTV